MGLRQPGGGSVEVHGVPPGVARSLEDSGRVRIRDFTLGHGADGFATQRHRFFQGWGNAEFQPRPQFPSRGFNTRQVLIVGRNDRAARLAERIEQSPELGFRLVGFIDAPNGECRGSYDYALNILGDLEDFERVLRENIADEVFLTLPVKSFYSEIDQLIEICETVGIEAKIPTDLFRLRSSKSTISHDLDLAVIDV